MKEIKENEGVLKPEHNSPHFLPQKNPHFDDQGITLYTHANTEYFIEWNRIKNPVDLLMFVHHLTEKVWINRRNIRFLIENACFKHKIGYLGK